MKLRSFLLLVLLVQTLISGIHAEEKPELLAQKAAETWLEEIDKGKYAASWDDAAATFQGAMSKEKWVAALEQVRKPLGKPSSRKLKGAEYKKSLPGAPDGEYVILQFDTSFAHKKESVETVTPMLAADGKWKVSGYFIK